MAKQEPAIILEEVIGEADALIRRRFAERGLEVPHLAVAVAPDGFVVQRSNVSPDALRSFAEDLNNVADELQSPSPTKPGRLEGWTPASEEDHFEKCPACGHMIDCRD